MDSYQGRVEHAIFRVLGFYGFRVLGYLPTNSKAKALNPKALNPESLRHFVLVSPVWPVNLPQNFF